VIRAPQESIMRQRLIVVLAAVVLTGTGSSAQTSATAPGGASGSAVDRSDRLVAPTSPPVVTGAPAHSAAVAPEPPATRSSWGWWAMIAFVIAALVLGLAAMLGVRRRARSARR
jgi:hypothetical protein